MQSPQKEYAGQGWISWTHFFQDPDDPSAAALVNQHPEKRPLAKRNQKVHSQPKPTKPKEPTMLRHELWSYEDALEYVQALNLKRWATVLLCRPPFPTGQRCFCLPAASPCLRLPERRAPASADPRTPRGLRRQQGGLDRVYACGTHPRRHPVAAQQGLPHGMAVVGLLAWPRRRGPGARLHDTSTGVL
jgi:hypothetical protein